MYEYICIEGSGKAQLHTLLAVSRTTHPKISSIHFGYSFPAQVKSIVSNGGPTLKPPHHHPSFLTSVRHTHTHTHKDPKDGKQSQHFPELSNLPFLSSCNLFYLHIIYILLFVKMENVYGEIYKVNENNDHNFSCYFFLNKLLFKFNKI